MFLGVTQNLKKFQKKILLSYKILLVKLERTKTWHLKSSNKGIGEYRRQNLFLHKQLNHKRLNKS